MEQDLLAQTDVGAMGGLFRQGQVEEAGLAMPSAVFEQAQFFWGKKPALPWLLAVTHHAMPNRAEDQKGGTRVQPLASREEI